MLKVLEQIMTWLTGDTKKQKVNKIFYVLAAVFGGTWGIHKFYAGKAWLCLAYILISWSGVSTVLGIIEGMIAFSKQSDKDGNIIV